MKGVEQREGAGIVVALLVSSLAHASPQLVALIQRLEPEPVVVVSWQPSLAPPLARIDFRAARMKLVADARKQKHLALGAFLLDAAAIDAAERGVGLEIARAEKEYQRRLSKVRASLHAGRDVQTAFAGAFGDMHYRGIAGGTMAEALIDGGGSCEPLSLLFAAALHDAGYAKQAYLRHYGGGVPHLAPIYLHLGDYEHDIMSGGRAHRGGMRFSARDLVEVYALAHGLPGTLATWRGPPPPKQDDKRDAPPPAASMFSLAAGYPQNGDRYPGTVALYAERALASPTESGPIGGSGGIQPDEWYARCSTGGAQLFRAQVAVLTSEPYSVELFDLPTRAELGSRAWWAARWEANDVSKQSVGEQLLWHACLSLAYDELADGFAAWSLPRLASIAADKAEQLRKIANAKAEKILASPAQRKKVVKELTTAEEAWMLLAISKADDLLLAAASSTAKDYDLSLKRHELNAALLTHPRTRARALEQVGKAVFFEQYLTASMLKIWSEGRGVQSAVPVDLGDDTEFARGYHLLTTLETQIAGLVSQPDGRGENVFLTLLRERVGPTWERGFRDALQKK